MFFLPPAVPIQIVEHHFDQSRLGACGAKIFTGRDVPHVFTRTTPARTSAPPSRESDAGGRDAQLCTVQRHGADPGSVGRFGRLAL